MPHIRLWKAALFGAAFCATELRADIAAITSQNDEMLSLIDTKTFKLLGTVALPGKPAALAVDRQRETILVIATDPGQLYVLDRTGKIVARWPLDGAPFGIAVEPETGQALISDLTGQLLWLDPATGVISRRVATGAMPSGVIAGKGFAAVAARDDDLVQIFKDGTRHDIAVGHHPFGLAQDGSRLFVTNVLSDTVSVIDLASLRVIGEIPTGERPYALSFAAGQGFVTNQYSASLSVFDAASLQPKAEISTDDYPEGIATAEAGRRIFVANWFSDTVQVFDSETHALLETIPVAAGPRAFGDFVLPMP